MLPQATCPLAAQCTCRLVYHSGWLAIALCVVTCLVDVSLCVCPVLQTQLIQQGLAGDAGGEVKCVKPTLESEQLGQGVVAFATF